MLQNTVLSCCHPGLNQTSTYRSANNQSAGTNGDEAEAFKKTKTGGAVMLLVYYCQGLTQSISPASASDMAERSSARSTAPPPASCSSYRTTVPPGYQQVRREPIRTDYLRFPVSCVRRRRISLKVDPWQLSTPFHIPLTLSALRLDAYQHDLGAVLPCSHRKMGKCICTVGLKSLHTPVKIACFVM